MRQMRASMHMLAGLALILAAARSCDARTGGPCSLRGMGCAMSGQAAVRGAGAEADGLGTPGAGASQYAYGQPGNNAGQEYTQLPGTAPHLTTGVVGEPAYLSDYDTSRQEVEESSQPAGCTSPTAPQAPGPLCGANLGGLYVLEPWMSTSSPTTNRVPPNLTTEYQISSYWDSKGDPQMITAHRKSFINETTLDALKAKGVSLLRVPLGFWATATKPQAPYVGGVLTLLDAMIDGAEKRGMRVLLSMHAAPGSQNGFEHSSPEALGQANWCSSTSYQTQTLGILKEWAHRYRGRRGFWGISVLNEPTCDPDLLLAFYTKAYATIRSVCPNIMVVISPNVYAQAADVRQSQDWRTMHLKALSAWGVGKTNVALDLHLYQTDFALGADVVGKWSLQNHIDYALNVTKPRIAALLALKGIPVIVGEWSLAGPVYSSVATIRAQELSAFRKAQLAAFSQPGVLAQIFWSARVDGNYAWSI